MAIEDGALLRAIDVAACLTSWGAESDECVLRVPALWRRFVLEVKNAGDWSAAPHQDDDDGPERHSAVRRA
jgi:hypothetical protein